MWTTDDGVILQVRVKERDEIALSNALVKVR